MSFNKIKPEDLNENVFKMIGSDWMLITAGSMAKFNTMTAAWGGMGFLWNLNVAFIFIRPQRYTFEFVERNKFFTLSFFTEENRRILNICGSKSGRNCDKIMETGLEPIETELGNIYFEQARLVLECRKIYYDDIKETNFVDKSLIDIYQRKDFHRMFIGEIIDVIYKPDSANQL